MLNLVVRRETARLFKVNDLYELAKRINIFGLADFLEQAFCWECCCSILQI
jgi:hypothetical protein